MSGRRPTGQGPPSPTRTASVQQEGATVTLQRRTLADTTQPGGRGQPRRQRTGGHHVPLTCCPERTQRHLCLPGPNHQTNPNGCAFYQTAARALQKHQGRERPSEAEDSQGPKAKETRQVGPTRALQRTLEQRGQREAGGAPRSAWASGPALFAPGFDARAVGTRGVTVLGLRLRRTEPCGRERPGETGRRGPGRLRLDTGPPFPPHLCPADRRLRALGGA